MSFKLNSQNEISDISLTNQIRQNNLINQIKSYKITNLNVQVYIVSPDDIVLSGTPSLTFDTEGFLSFGVRITSARASTNLKDIPVHVRKCR